MPRNVSAFFSFLLVVPVCFLARADGAAGARLIRTIAAHAYAPEDIAFDSSGEGSYWVTSYLDHELSRYDTSWNYLGSIPSPFFPTTPLTGIAYNSDHDTLLVINPVVNEIVELAKTGEPTGLWIRLELDPVVNPYGGPFVRALAYVPQSDLLDAAILVYESVAAKIYGFSLDGTRLFDFVHVDDPDGYPGHGTGVGGGGILPIRSPGGDLVGVEFTGRNGGESVIRTVELTPRLEAIHRGRYVPLAGLSGLAAGFERGREQDPDTGEEIDVFYVAVDTQHSFFVFRTDPLPLYEPFELSCAAQGDAVEFSWKNAGDYERIVLRRDGVERAVLAGAAATFRDEGVPPGDHEYELWGERAAERTRSLGCGTAIGQGQVLARIELPGDSAGGATVGPDGLLWITDPYKLEIMRFDPATMSLGETLPMPLEPPNPDEPFWPARIACDPAARIIYLLETKKVVLYAFNDALDPVGEPKPLALNPDPEAKVYAGAMAFYPTGDGGKGSLLIVEEGESKVHELSRDGAVLRSLRHPDWDAEPVPEGSTYGPFTFGIAVAPTGGGSRLDLTGGAVWDRETTRIVRVAAADGAPTGFEVPFAGMAHFASPGAVSILWHGGRLFALNQYELAGVLYELRSAEDPVPPTDLACGQTSLEDAVSISFRNNVPYEKIAVARDNENLAELSGNATSFTDRPAPRGAHRYSIVAFRGGKPLWPLACDVRVGPGAHLAHAILWPPRFVETAAVDPIDGTYFVTSNAYDERGKVFHLDRDGKLLEEIASPYDLPWSVAAIAVSPRGAAGRSLTTIGWSTGGGIDEVLPILLTHQSETGAILFGPKEFKPPTMPRPPYILYPASLQWDRGSGFWFLERNAGILWHIDGSGNFLESFVHPAPATDQFVYATATSLCLDRGVYYLSTNSPGVDELTRYVESTLDGILTGHEIPLDGLGFTTLTAAFVDGTTLHAFGSRASLPALITAKAFDDGPAVTNLRSSLEDRRPRLTWEVAGAADRIVVERNGAVIAELPGSARDALDANPVEKSKNLYVVRAFAGGAAGPHAALAVFAPPPESEFIRGDANRSDGVNIADAIFALSYLFARGPKPPCLDAADANDDGAIAISDPIYILQFLFARGPTFRQPYPTAGFDPTGDALTCWP